MGRVPGDYLAGYYTAWHYPDPAGYYFKIWPDPDPGNLSRFLQLSTIPHAVKRKVGIYFVLRPSLMHDTVASRVTYYMPT